MAAACRLVVGIIALMAASGCQDSSTASMPGSNKGATLAFNTAREPAGMPAPAAAETSASGQSIDPPAPTGNTYRAQLLATAMRGLLYENETVTVDVAVAPQIAAPGTRAEAIAALTAGRAALEANEPHGAIAGFTRAILIDATFVDAYRMLGTALGVRGKDRDALCAYRKAVELAPGDVEAQVQLAWGLGRLGRTADEVAAWEKVIDMDPKHAEAHGRLAIALYVSEDLSAAQAEIEVAQSLGYEFPAQFLDQVALDSAENR